MSDKRIEALEIKIAHLERLGTDLSDTVARQADEIARLERRVTLLMRAAAEREAETGPLPIADRPPPHY